MTEIDQTATTDSMSDRNRYSRITFMISAFAIVLMVFAAIVYRTTEDWFGLGRYGALVGLGLGALVISLLLPHMIVKVNVNHAFLTVDGLRSFFGNKNVFILYGSGKHPSYPWEIRSATNNVSLQEASENAEVSINTSTGIVHIKFSYRLRPRFEREALVRFLGGVAVIAADVGDLMKGFLNGVVAPMTADEAKNAVGPLNEALSKKFGHGEGSSKDPEISKFEERFGIVFGDATISEVRLSAEAEKTRSGIDEAKTIALGTAILIGFSDTAQMQEAIKSGSLSQADASKGRDRYLAVSEQIKMELGATEFTLKIDANPDVVRAISDVSPALLQAARALTGNKKKGGK